MTKWLTTTLFFLLLFVPSPITAQSPNVTGGWEVKLKTPRGEFDFKVSLKQEGEKLSGVIKGPRGVRSEEVQGMVRGAELRASCNFNEAGNKIPVGLVGEVKGDSMKGKADFGGFYEGDWIAVRMAETSSGEATHAAMSPAPQSEKCDVSGVWVFDVETPAGTSFPAFIFKQEGETLTGQFKGALGESPLTGTVRDAEIRFSFKVQPQGTETIFTYIGTIEKNSMKGTAQLGNLGSASWTGKRQ